jgi:adenosylcobalamin phosphodiesterase
MAAGAPRPGQDRLKMPALKRRFPFRLGTTSYIIPDEILPNVEFLAPRVDDIQLVLFESEEISNLPDAATLEKLAGFKPSHDLSYTVHLPLDAQLGAADEEHRSNSVAKCRRVIELTAPLEPLCWNLHLDGRMRGDPPAADLEDWRTALSRSLDELLPLLPDPRAICVETLDYPLELVAGLIADFDLSVCIDVGHLLMNDFSLAQTFERFAPRCRVVHLHGIRDGHDHRDIAALPAGTAELVIEQLSTPGAADRVLTLEVFNPEDFEKSMTVMEDYAP